MPEQQVAENPNKPTRSQRAWFLISVDAFFIAAALLLAYVLGFDQGSDEQKIYLPQYLWIAGPAVVIRLLVFWFSGHYRSITIFSSIHEIISMGYAILIGTIIFFLLNPIYGHWHPPADLLGQLGRLVEADGTMLRIPWRILCLEGILSFLLVGFARIWPRVFIIYFSTKHEDEHRVVIIGANKAGVNAARMLNEDPTSAYRPVAFIDDNVSLHGKMVSGIPVAGSLERLQETVELRKADEILIALPDAAPKDIQKIINECEKAHVSFRRIPSVDEVMSGRVTVDQLRPVEIEDLLGRPQVDLVLSPDRNYLSGECVLITGAGGSIGSELVRQCLKHDPEQLVLMGRGENSIYEIATELGYDYKSTQLRLVIGDVRNEEKLRWVFEKYRPGIVFHAAAHKHVPLMELHPDEAIENNVFGTLRCAQLADEFKVKKFILISTDKAVRPTNVMGASKRLAEMAVQTVSQHSNVAFHVVRFGNVLGSRGSVIPLMQRQVRNGGPVTVTHPEVTRYFMTIPEACSLVIQAGSFNDKNQLFLLDMGQPVKIIDLARNIITLSGYEPEEDIEIVYTGLRPGEKLKEELLTQGEGIHKTELGKLFVAEREPIDPEQFTQTLERLRKAAREKNTDEIRAILHDAVPDYSPAP
ncbi:polysaccharide biosynthesis protein [Candidatus Sumerlaeota bacterium]|nr:polysaccharide biosynthesis protein [Candidatus Sumerlaeota bacterium]